MSFNFRQVAHMVGLATLAVGSLLVSQNVEAQLFRANNCTCQPVRVVRPACPVYYQVQGMPSQSIYAQQAFAQPVYSTIAANQSFSPVYGETIISQSAIISPITNEIAGPQIINGVIETQTFAAPIQRSVSDIPMDSNVVPATFNQPTPAAIEPVPAASPTTQSPEPAKTEPAAAPQTDEGKTEKSILTSNDDT